MVTLVASHILSHESEFCFFLNLFLLTAIDIFPEVKTLVLIISFTNSHFVLF
jgi:hypothetical protein